MTGLDSTEAPCVTDLRESRLNTYRERPGDISSHYTGEGENEEGYYGRFAYELIQNADDALGDTSDSDNPYKARFELRTGANPSLIVANTGPPIDEDDARALTAIGGTTKRDADRKATIGHKGRGFSAVLEITDRPYVFSTDVSFMFDRDRSRNRIESVVTELNDWDMDDVAGIPLMRLPFAPNHRPDRVEKLLEDDHNTVFYFPLHEKAVPAVKDALESLDDQTALFLNNLKRLEIDIDNTQTTWRIGRHDSNLEAIESSVDTVKIRRDDGQGRSETGFLRLTRDSVPVGDNTRGISNNTWGDLSETQVSVAVRRETREDGTHLLPVRNEPMVHVFLPTEERSPVPLLVNGAFDSDLARKSIDITTHNTDYNRFLIRKAAEIIAADLATLARETATTATEFLSCVDFTTWRDPDSRDRFTYRDELIRGLQDELPDVPCVPVAGNGDEQSYLTPSETLIPSVLGGARDSMRDFITNYGNREVTVETDDEVVTGYFPNANLLAAEFDYVPPVLETLGAAEFSVEHLPSLLPELPEKWFRIDRYPPGPQQRAIDPVIELVTAVWSHLNDDAQETFAVLAKRHALIPVGTPDSDGTVKRVRAVETELYRPRKDSDIDVDVPGVQFITEYVYRPRGQLGSTANPPAVQQRQSVINQVWRPDKFQFEELVRSTVATRQPQPDQETPEVTIKLLALLRELGSETANPDYPLPLRDRYEAQPLHRLCRLPVPTTDGDWEPACRVYFSDEWLPDDRQHSVEELFNLAEIDAPTLVSPDELKNQLEQEFLTGEDEFSQDSWYVFFRWIGVSPHLRLKPFFAPNEQRQFSETVAEGGVNRPSNGGSILGNLDDEEWTDYKAHLESALDEMAAGRRDYDSIYRVNSFEYWDQLKRAARRDTAVGQRLVDHLISWWKPVLSSHRGTTLATHDYDGFGRRNSNAPSDDELRSVGTNLWLWQLQTTSWCPTTRGPLSPDVAWNLPKGQTNPFTVGEHPLLPVLERTLDPATYEAQPLLEELGVRQHLSSETFKPEDARAVCKGLADVCDTEKVNIEGSLREIQPIYRQIQDLAPPVDEPLPLDSCWIDATEVLESCPVLCRFSGSFSFREAQNAYFTRSPSVRANYPFDDLPFFILEEQRAARFGEYFGLHDFTAAVTEDGDQIMNRDDRTESVRSHLTECAPYILCRLEAERPSQRLIDQDRSRMQSFIEQVAIFDEIEVTYVLDPIGEESPREVTTSTEFYIETQYEGSVEHRHPQLAAREIDREQWQLLARALCAYLDVTQFEGIDALLAASTDEERRRYLQYANAPSSSRAIEQKNEALQDDTASEPASFGAPQDLSEPSTEDETESESNSDETTPTSSDTPAVGGTTQPQMRTLYDDANLRVSGKSISVEPSPNTRLPDDSEVDLPEDVDDSIIADEETLKETASGDTRRSQSQYNVEDLGAALVEAWEELRLRRDYPDCEDPSAFIFSTDERRAVEEARRHPNGEYAFEILEQEAGIPKHFPGFDFLTVNPETKEPDRLIELKAGTGNRRTPSISWNEWTTARNKWIQQQDEPLYYLYVVGHLSKRTSSDPYIRTVPNPFRLLDAQIERDVSVTKSVQVDVNAFTGIDAIPGVEAVQEIPVQTMDEREE